MHSVVPILCTLVARNKFRLLLKHLNHTGLPVAVYHGQLDLICSSLGLEAWLPKLQWKGLAKIQSATPEPIYAFGPKGGKTTGFVRQHDNLSIFIMLNAGHMVPADQPAASLDLLGTHSQ